jgi:hypothetical protein
MLAGLEGLGISFMLAYVFLFIQVFFLARNKYSFSFNLEFYKIGGIQILLGISCFVMISYLNSPLSFYHREFFYNYIITSLI